MSKTVVLVGLAPGTREMAFDEPEGVEMWSLNQGHAIFATEDLPRFTRWFQIHPWDEMISRQNPVFKHLEWLKTTTLPVYLEELHPEEVPSGVRYPFEAVCEYLGRDYFTSAMAFMMALAMYEGFETIKLYGLEMAHGTEYFDQRPCLEYLAGMAKAKGIEVVVPEVCPLFKGQRYAKTVMIPSTVISKKMGELNFQKVVKKAETNALGGSLNLMRELLAVDYPEEIHNDLGQRYEDLLTEYKSKLGEFHAVVGAEALCEEFIKEALRGEKATLEPVFEAGRDQGNDYHPELLPPGVSINHEPEQAVSNDGNVTEPDQAATWEPAPPEIAPTPEPVRKLERPTEGIYKR